jgi:hypothetical protein
LAAVNVTQAADTRIIVNNNIQQHVRAYSSVAGAALEVREGAWWVINADSTVNGLITGTGSVQVGASYSSVGLMGHAIGAASTNYPVRPHTTAVEIALTTPTVRIFNQNNNYRGDTRVTIASTLVINHEHNLGGTIMGTLYLEPHTGYGVGVYPPISTG